MTLAVRLGIIAAGNPACFDLPGKRIFANFLFAVHNIFTANRDVSH